MLRTYRLILLKKQRKWQITDKREKEKIKMKKKEIQKALRAELGMLIDMLKEDSGKTNDGNTARVSSSILIKSFLRRSMDGVRQSMGRSEKGGVQRSEFQ